jgi:23S rRNA (cytosine1962-C5)-methyltransferase
MLKRGEERRIAAGHPWVFSNEIDTEHSPLSAFAPGALAEIATHRGGFVGYGYVNPHALICARILSRNAAHPVDRALIERRLTAAHALRTRLSAAPYYRWVFGESDALPGLVLDRYGDVVVGQIATAGMEALKEEVAAAVRAVLAPAGLYWKNDTAARDLEQLPQEAQLAFGAVPDELTVIESGLSFSAPLVHGQKTGWF